MEKYILDGLILLLALIIVIYSAKKGFVSTVLGTVSVVGATVLSRNLSIIASEFIYSSFLRVKITEKICDAVNGLSDSITIPEKVDAMLSSFPVWMLRISEASGIDLKTLSYELLKTDSSGEVFIENFTDSVVYPVVTEILNILFFVIFFVLLIVLFFNISKLLSKIIQKLPIIGKANTFFGFVLGVLKSFAIVFIICSILNIVAFLFEIQELKLLLSDSIIFNYINNILI